MKLCTKSIATCLFRWLDQRTIKLLFLRAKTTPQDAHKRLVLQVYLSLNTSEISALGKQSSLTAT